MKESIDMDTLLQPEDGDDLKSTRDVHATDLVVEHPGTDSEQRSEETMRGRFKDSIAYNILRNYEFRNFKLGVTGTSNAPVSSPYNLTRNLLGCIASDAVQEQAVEGCIQQADDQSLPEQHHKPPHIKRPSTIRVRWNSFKKGIGKLSGNNSERLRLENEMLQAEIAALQGKINDLETRAVFFDNPNDGAWKESNTVQQYMAQEVSKAVRDSESLWFGRLLPHANVGALLRHRRLEHRRAPAKKNTELIRQGDEAAHYGKAIADAALYHPALSNRRTDEETYISTYGFTPFQVYRFRDCKPLIQILDWYGSVIDWHHPSAFPHTSFAKAWPSDLFEKYKNATPDIVQADFADGKQAELLQTLKAAYLKEEAANRAQHAR